MCRTTAVAGNIQHWAEYSLPARPIYHPASCAENDWSYGRLDAPKEFCLLGSRAPDVERDYPPHPTHQAPRSPLSIADIDPANEPLAIFEVRPHPEAGVVLLSHRHTSTRARLRPGELCIEAALPGGGAGWDDSGGWDAMTGRLGLVEVVVIAAARADDPPHLICAATESAALAALAPPPSSLRTPVAAGRSTAAAAAAAAAGRLFVLSECLIRVGAVRA